MKRTAGVITELHDVIRKKIHEISNGDDAEAASMAKRWFDLVEDTNFDGINFNEDIYEKLVSSKSVPADMSYFTFRNHFLTKIIEPVRAAVLEFLTEKDSSLKRDRDELDWISGFLDNYVTIASTNRVVAELRKEYVNNKAELNAAHKWVDKVFGMDNGTMNKENGTMNKLAMRIERIAKVLESNDSGIYKILRNYCRKVIDNYDDFEDLALDKINDLRCSLQYASPELYDKMADAVEEYCDDHDIENEFDVEDVFWAD